MTNITELRRILITHSRWLANNPNGMCANLRKTDLRGAFLPNEDLCGAILCEADLRKANLRKTLLRGADMSMASVAYADLYGADLSMSCLYGTILREANLRKANLCGANLRNADLGKANLQGASLYKADLRETNLMMTDLSDADIRETCLDPANEIPDASMAIIAAGFAVNSDGDFRAMRTKKSIYVSETVYTEGLYVAPYFSTDTLTDCHPGLYFCTEAYYKERYEWQDAVTVQVNIRDCVATVGGKFRCRKFIVL